MNKLMCFMDVQKKSLSFLFVLLIGNVFYIQAQSNEERQIKTVFSHLVTAYGSAKAAPQLEFINIATKAATPAFYRNNKIQVDIRFYGLCQTFGKDSLNALAIVLSHELAHYYYDHSFCTDFAFAIRNKSQEFAASIKLVNKNQKIIYETQADDKGLFYAAIAGYTPFEIQSKLLDDIYQIYQLRDNIDGYPTKVERKAIGQNALAKSQKLYLVFQEALKAKEQKEFDRALALFEEVNRDFPSRENYNNCGVIKSLQALDLKVLSSEEYHCPKRFLYPLEVDNTSRLNKEVTRGMDDDNYERMIILLQSAQKDFEKAISLDPKYILAYVNLACVFDLLDNPEAAIGKIKELPMEQQKLIIAQQILAIAYYHNNQEQKAEEIWSKFKK